MATNTVRIVTVLLVTFLLNIVNNQVTIQSSDTSTYMFYNCHCQEFNCSGNDLETTTMGTNSGSVGKQKFENCKCDSYRNCSSIQNETTSFNSNTNLNFANFSKCFIINDNSSCQQNNSNLLDSNSTIFKVEITATNQISSGNTTVTLLCSQPQLEVCPGFEMGNSTGNDFISQSSTELTTTLYTSTSTTTTSTSRTNSPTTTAAAANEFETNLQSLIIITVIVGVCILLAIAVCIFIINKQRKMSINYEKQKKALKIVTTNNNINHDIEDNYHRTERTNENTEPKTVY